MVLKTRSDWPIRPLTSHGSDPVRSIGPKSSWIRNKTCWIDGSTGELDELNGSLSELFDSTFFFPTTLPMRLPPPTIASSCCCRPLVGWMSLSYQQNSSPLPSIIPSSRFFIFIFYLISLLFIFFYIYYIFTL